MINIVILASWSLLLNQQLNRQTTGEKATSKQIDVQR